MGKFLLWVRLSRFDVSSHEKRLFLHVTSGEYFMRHFSALAVLITIILAPQRRADDGEKEENDNMNSHSHTSISLFISALQSSRNALVSSGFRCCSVQIRIRFRHFSFAHYIVPHS